MGSSPYVKGSVRLNSFGSSTDFGTGPDGGAGNGVIGFWGRALNLSFMSLFMFVFAGVFVFVFVAVFALRLRRVLFGPAVTTGASPRAFATTSSTMRAISS